jgi:CrcB protein
LTLVLVALGAAVGAVLRWWLGDVAPTGSGFPWVTFAVNLSGCFALACLPAVAAVRDRPGLAAALGPGLLGGYTTMSAYAEETRVLLADDRVLAAAAYAVGTVVACLLAVALAERLTGRMPTTVVEP